MAVIHIPCNHLLIVVLLPWQWINVVTATNGGDACRVGLILVKLIHSELHSRNLSFKCQSSSTSNTYNSTSAPRWHHVQNIPSSTINGYVKAHHPQLSKTRYAGGMELWRLTLQASLWANGIFLANLKLGGKPFEGDVFEPAEGGEQAHQRTCYCLSRQEMSGERAFRRD